MNNTVTFSYTEPIRFGWGRLKKYWKMLLIYFAVMFGIQFVGGTLAEFIGSSVTFLGWLLQLVLWLVSVVLQLGMAMLALWVVDDKGEDFGTFVQSVMDRVSARWVGLYILATILMVIIVGLGFLLLIVPGVILLIMLQFYNYAYVDGVVGVRAPLRKSREITAGNRMRLFIFMWVLVGFNLLGFLALVVGLVVTSMVSMVAMAYLYRVLSGTLEGGDNQQNQGLDQQSSENVGQQPMQPQAPQGSSNEPVAQPGVPPHQPTGVSGMGMPRPGE